MANRMLTPMLANATPVLQDGNDALSGRDPIYYNPYLMPNRDPIVANLSVALAGLCATVAPSMTLITEES